MVIDSTNIRLFIFASLALIIMPGPNTLYVITRGITQGRKAAFISALGASSGDLLYAVSAALGLVIILQRSATLYGIIKICGALYLMYIGIQNIISEKKILQHSTRFLKQESCGRLYLKGFLIAALNPKTAIFFASFLPQFVNAGSKYAAYSMLSHGIIFFLMGIAVLTCYAQTSCLIGNWILKNGNSERRFRLVTGSIFLGLGIKLIMQEDG